MVTLEARYLKVNPFELLWSVSEWNLFLGKQELVSISLENLKLYCLQGWGEGEN